MKLKLKKEELTTLSNDNETLPQELTPQVGGGQQDAENDANDIGITLGCCGSWCCMPTHMCETQ